LHESNEPAPIVVATQLKRATTIWSRFRGLMLRSRLEPGEALAIEPCASIHMFFMRFSIDAVFYDRQHRVTKVRSRVLPWIGLAFGGPGARGVVELAAGAAAGVRAGDQLHFTEDGTLTASRSDES
jgi:uncharacterized protein